MRAVKTLHGASLKETNTFRPPQLPPKTVPSSHSPTCPPWSRKTSWTLSPPWKAKGASCHQLFPQCPMAVCHTSRAHAQFCSRRNKTPDSCCPPALANKPLSQPAVGLEAGPEAFQRHKVPQPPPFSPEDQSKADKWYRAKHRSGILKNCDSCTKSLTDHISRDQKRKCVGFIRMSQGTPDSP